MYGCSSHVECNVAAYLSASCTSKMLALGCWHPAAGIDASGIQRTWNRCIERRRISPALLGALKIVGGGTCGSKPSGRHRRGVLVHSAV